MDPRRYVPVQLPEENASDIRGMDKSLISRNEAKAFLYDLIKSGVVISSHMDLARYIKNNRNLDRYPHIVGELKLKDGVNKWVYDRGIIPQWYKFICRELGLTKTNSSIVAEGFTSYSEMKKTKYE